MTNMRAIKRIGILAAVAGGLVFSAAPGQARVINKIVAKINDKVITALELDEEIFSFKVQMEKLGSKEEVKDLRRKVLDKLVDKRLLLQEAVRLGIQARDRDIDEALREIKDRFGNDEKFEEALTLEGFTLSQYRRKLSEEIAVQKVVEREVKSKIDVTDGEIAAYYEAHKKEMVMPETVRASHILIAVDPSLKGAARDKALTEARAKVQAVRDELKKGKSFEEMARQYSMDEGSRDKGGDLGYFRKDEMVKEFSRAAFAAKSGTVAGPVQTNYGFHLIQVVDRKPVTAMSLDESTGEGEGRIPLRNKIKYVIQNEKLKTELQSYAEALRAKAVIEIVDISLLPKDAASPDPKAEKTPQKPPEARSGKSVQTPGTTPVPVISTPVPTPDKVK